MSPESDLVEERSSFPIRVLYAASSPADGEFVRAETSAHSPLISLTCATGAEEALSCLDGIGPFDAVLIDPDLPDGNPQALISRIRHHNPRVGIVACVPGDDAALATPALDAGAHAWIPKRRDTIAQLYPVFRRAMDSTGPAQTSAGKPADVPSDQVTAAAPIAGVSSDGFDAALAMREATLAHEAERAGLELALAAERAETARLAVELAAARTAHETQRQESDGLVRAALEAARVERDTLRTAIAEREGARAALASELVARAQQHASVLAELEATVEARDRQIATLTAEVEAARAVRPAAPTAPQAHERDRLDARAEAGRLIADVTDDIDALLSGLEREHQRLRDAFASGNANVEMLGGLERPLREGRALTRMLRAFSRREVQRARLTDLTALMESMRPTIARWFDEDVQVDFASAPDAEPVAIDPRHVEFMLMSVIMAVRTQLPTGGRVRIVVRPSAATDDHGAAAGSGAELEVSATRWRHDIAIPELASDRWLTPAIAESLNLAHIESVLKADGGWLDTSRTTPDQIVIRMRLAGA